MKALMRTGIATLATSVGAGLVVMGVSAANAGGDDQAYAKREDSANAWVLSADDDDDGDDDGFRLSDTNTRTRTGGSDGTHTRTRSHGTHTKIGTNHTRTNTGRSGDKTGSRYSGVSRDRDNSWGDRTRDWTRDGKGGATRDFSANLTNDNSRNDTRR
jgi:hypothetical protein